MPPSEPGKARFALRVAVYNVSLGRDGPGLLLRDLEKGTDRQIKAVSEIIVRIAPDILLLNDFDFDLGNVALGVFAQGLRELGIDYPYLFALPSNAGLASGVDLDGDGRSNGPGDAQGFGEFSGAEGMAILSRYPIAVEEVQDFSALLWRDLPGAVLPTQAGKPFPSEAAQATQRLAYRGFWVVPVILPDGQILQLLASHATPPVFDGPEDQNGLRNRDEIRFWSLYLNGKLPGVAPLDGPFVLLGDFNADPNDGEGARDAINALLNDPRLQDPKPVSAGAAEATQVQGGVNLSQQGDPALDTADWREDNGPGNLRVDYVLPSADLIIRDAGVFWPASDDDLASLLSALDPVVSRHALVWVDLGR